MALMPVALCAGCGADAGVLDDDTGTAVASITSVPTGVQCVRIIARGVTRSFAVTGGVSSVLNLGPQPSGSLLVSGQAYNVACGSVTTSTVATWVSDPVTVTVVAGLTTNVALTMRPNVPTNVSVDFVNPVTSIAVGDGFSLAVMADGTVRAWGSNRDGQLGDATTTSRPSPVVVSDLTNVRQVSAGATHACAVLNDGSARCWGRDDYGHLGIGFITQSPVPVPVTLPAGVSLTQISVGRYTTCAVDAGGGAWCWGHNFSGQVGDNSTTPRPQPVRVLDTEGAALSRVIEVSVGESHACARFSNSGVACWGDDSYGQFGAFGPSGNHLTASSSGFFLVTSVSADNAFTCGLGMDGVVRCTGYNLYGYLGDGTTMTRFVPGPVVGLSGVVRVSSHHGNSCAVLSDGTAWCWGINTYGQLGDVTGQSRSTPVQVRGLGNVAEVMAGGSHACARLTDGTVWCWGSNESGALGDGTVNWRFTPARVRL